ncbi:hypothetical protein [Geomicrobium sp. JCM 19039]|uniref:hypothetical protein n=1 Tax=Geomicrobium sp. JCM 19039 TaxID=1460636 RepID=UPI00045F21F9|nr:hypothetical protein [Geomicrobium sp. JCM 19039]GAK12244.1 hypothetical protein JCM19039_1999 [Geomicrobium sp. JCM 19039]
MPDSNGALEEVRAQAAYGTKLKRRDLGGSESDFEDIARLDDIGGPSLEKDEIEVTGHDSQMDTRSISEG